MKRQVTKWMGGALGLLLSVHAVGSEAFAQTAVPEISPASISSGIALIAGGVLILRSRRRSK